MESWCWSLSDDGWFAMELSGLVVGDGCISIINTFCYPISFLSWFTPKHPHVPQYLRSMGPTRFRGQAVHHMIYNATACPGEDAKVMKGEDEDNRLIQILADRAAKRPAKGTRC
jgi:hypothetical protein